MWIFLHLLQIPVQCLIQERTGMTTHHNTASAFSTWSCKNKVAAESLPDAPSLCYCELVHLHSSYETSSTKELLWVSQDFHAASSQGVNWTFDNEEGSDHECWLLHLFFWSQDEFEHCEGFEEKTNRLSDKADQEKRCYKHHMVVWCTITKHYLKSERGWYQPWILQKERLTDTDSLSRRDKVLYLDDDVYHVFKWSSAGNSWWHLGMLRGPSCLSDAIISDIADVHRSLASSTASPTSEIDVTILMNACYTSQWGNTLRRRCGSYDCAPK